ncbi:hypothetical protein GGF43_000565 [Coemansia sp. RSA 2618]|nr:hypothetical protein GGF43_000565 [Coemansia sp. RSA 2618]
MDPEIDPSTQAALRKDPLKTALTLSTLKAFHIAKQFPDNKAPITSVDFDLSGTRCVTTSGDESLRIYDCQSGTREQVSYSKKYGCNLAQFTEQAGSIAYASTKINDTIRYLSYETNQFIRYFVGHTGLVTSLERAPGGDGLVSGSVDGTVRVWGLDEIRPVCTVDVGGGENVAAAYDPSGMVVAVAVGSREVRMYDVRKMTRGPFVSAPVSVGMRVAGIQFVPPTGDHVLLAMSDGSAVLLDAFQLSSCAVLSGTGGSPHDGAATQQCFGQRITTTPDGRMAIAGCDNGSVVFWDLDRALANADAKGPVVCKPDGMWNGSHDGPVGICAFNPLMMECATGSQSLTLWTSV